ncbi:Arylsulfotransferase (ASST) [Chitinophaga costaii]|uniref:Arylsulfotransferase (ASST) n=1 Tax=Chitinophaga costaii TaxID=1335309 RepID=A0A1C4G6A7_9BACT|nr:aryl-sulfate sulfotransferase [Chitinophaga costaii]PUZ19700.1 hypothetical protein DCM91_20245 [Chitinophaga costaii]SCC63281.1 Arylsulfotransferase (ASST) [Chitinophaga costaii]
MGLKKHTLLRIAILALAIAGAIVAWIWAPLNEYFLPPRIKHVALLNLPGNRLRFQVMVTCSKPCPLYLRYWKLNSRDTFYTTTSSPQVHDTLTITNTEADTRYQFQVMMAPYPGQPGKVHNFNTGLIYHATPYFDLEYVDTAFAPAIKDQYFLTQILTEPGSLVILNSKGNIVWYEPFKKGVKVSHWTPQHTILCITGSENIPASGGDEIIETDLQGHVLRHLQTGHGDMDELVHHEVRTDTAQALYALTFTTQLRNLLSVGGAANDTIHGDAIVLFDRHDKKIWHWSSLDHLDPLHEKDILKKKKDWGHANALFRLPNGDFLISFRDFSQIWKVRYPDGKVLWKLGQGGDFALPDSAVFSGQHAIQVNDAGQLTMLDNGMNRKQGRALSLALDTVQHTVRVLVNTPIPKQYFSATKGNMQVLDSQHLLFCLTDTRVFLIEDLQGQVHWKINLAGDPYRLEIASGFLTPKPVYHE